MAGKGDIYQFGVFNGHSMRYLRTSNWPKAHFWGFDSFEGLPAVKNEAVVKDWHEGKYRTSVNLTQLTTDLGGPQKVGFIKGFYNNSLTPNLRHDSGMGPAEYIDVDCDLYVSSFQALDWAFRSHVAVPGTLVGYDDWWVTPCGAGGENLSPLETGEGKAHFEISQKYGVRFRCLTGACKWRSKKAVNAFGPVFVIESIGNQTAEHGFEMTHDQINDFKKQGHCAHEHEAKGAAVMKVPADS
eukprot:gnl/TRDRNA2_/TRDRNA2_168172_c0_seq1.p1 gnl/TRDRNA2_/TRDRNA2_168172_c0~~gnl/TRDRNA2_/TRDRNA2_168172_c0_seq1.p1  ORF type:complete len:242 (+),score=36.08 gnl/TRDRNA2_/TRDRNA2_168172_c0_seq1:245-970(+)